MNSDIDGNRPPEMPKSKKKKATRERKEAETETPPTSTATFPEKAKCDPGRAKVGAALASFKIPKRKAPVEDPERDNGDKEKESCSGNANSSLPDSAKRMRHSGPNEPVRLAVPQRKKPPVTGSGPPGKLQAAERDRHLLKATRRGLTPNTNDQHTNKSNSYSKRLETTPNSSNKETQLVRDAAETPQMTIVRKAMLSKRKHDAGETSQMAMVRKSMPSNNKQKANLAEAKYLPLPVVSKRTSGRIINAETPKPFIAEPKKRTRKTGANTKPTPPPPLPQPRQPAISKPLDHALSDGESRMETHRSDTSIINQTSNNLVMSPNISAETIETRLLSFCNQNVEPNLTEPMDAMDVDEIAILPGQQKRIIIVVDTNVWISNQNMIEDLLKTQFRTPSGSVQATVIIPWMVLQEIDSNIHRNPSEVKFRKASKYIYSLLSSKHPHVKGQKAIEALTGMEFSEMIADDSILNCAIQYNKIPQFITVLLTNDVNLLNKAMVNNLNASKADDKLIKVISDLCGIAESPFCSVQMNEQQASTSDAPSHNNSDAPFQTNHAFGSPSESILNQSCDNGALEDFEMDVDDPMGENEVELNVDTSNSVTVYNHVPMPTSPFPAAAAVLPPPTFETVVTAAQQALTMIIIPRMVEEYGKDGWKFAIKVKPPFTIESAIKCIKSHWIAVFTYMFPARGGDIMDQLLQMFGNKPGVTANQMDVLRWRTSICKLLKSLLTINPDVLKRPRVMECISLVDAFARANQMNQMDDMHLTS